MKSILLTQVWPNVSLLAVLMIVYSMYVRLDCVSRRADLFVVSIQPIICLLGVVVFFLYYMAYKYLFVFV